MTIISRDLHCENVSRYLHNNIIIALKPVDNHLFKFINLYAKL